MNPAIFVRDDETLETMSRAAYTTLSSKLADGNVSALAWTDELVSKAMDHGLIHDNTCYPNFYEDMVAAIRDEIQTASERDITISHMLPYLDKMELAGFYPVFEIRPGLMDSKLKDMEPTFWMYCQDDKLLPVSTPVMRFSVTALGTIQFQLFETAWLKQAVVSGPQPATKPKAKAPKKAKVKG